MTIVINPRKNGAYTIVEILVVITILAILGGISVSAYRGIQERAEVNTCMGRMRSLHQFAALHVADKKTWPYPDHVSPSDSEAWGKAWQELTKDYDLLPHDLVCPTNQRGLGDPDLIEQPRIDYMAMPFSAGTWAPYRYGRQPWFVEAGDFHGNGNLIIFPDGHIESLSDLVQ